MKGKGRLYLGICFLCLTLPLALLTGCSQSSKTPSQAGGPPSPEKDVERIEENGVLKVGVTDYAPIDYLENEEWTGFDADLAKEFAKWLCGAEVSFVEIDWDKKTELLEKGEIDCIWNAMTRTQPLLQVIDCSDPYLFTAEVIVLPESQMTRYDAAEKCYHLLFAVEAGSSAEKSALDGKLRILTLDGQNEALAAVEDKQADAAIVDKIFAALMTAEGATYENLAYGFPFDEEDLCVGLRKGSTLTEKVNQFLTESRNNGTLLTIAEKYGLADVLSP